MEVKVAICPVCLENLNDDVIFCSDGYLYDQKCFDGLNLISPITREKITYYIPFERIDDKIVRFEKEIRNNTSLIIYNSAGFNQYGFDKEGFDKNGFNKFGFNKEGIDRDGFDKFGFNKIGFNREKVLVDLDKAKKAINEDPWNIFYAVESVRDNYELIKECVENEPNTYKYASPNLKTNIDLAKLFIEKGGSFNLLNKSIRNNKSVAILSVQSNPKNYQHLSKELKNDDQIFETVVKLDKRVIGRASERLRKRYLSSINDIPN